MDNRQNTATGDVAFVVEPLTELNVEGLTTTKTLKVTGNSIKVGDAEISEVQLKKLIEFLDGNATIAITPKANNSLVLDNFFGHSGNLIAAQDKSSIQFQSASGQIQSGTRASDLHPCWQMQIKLLAE